LFNLYSLLYTGIQTLLAIALQRRSGATLEDLQEQVAVLLIRARLYYGPRPR
jgi:hypothetical protein